MKIKMIIIKVIIIIVVTITIMIIIQAWGILLLLHLPHHHRILYDQHLRRFCHCHLPERGRGRIPRLCTGQKSGIKLQKLILQDIFLNLVFNWIFDSMNSCLNSEKLFKILFRWIKFFVKFFWSMHIIFWRNCITYFCRGIVFNLRWTLSLYEDTFQRTQSSTGTVQ